MRPGIIVHGGAGAIAEREYPARLAGVRAAAEAGWLSLHAGMTALDAVERAVRVLEDHPLFNAGRGSVPNRDGQIEMDARVMEGRTSAIGAVGAVRRIAHPVSLARRVMEFSPHHFLVADGAEAFAQEQGIEWVARESLLVSPEERSALLEGGDTVGAVALDVSGLVAVAVSTGGVRGKLPGRIGDSPIAGAGAYAENGLGGACATGIGEGIMRALLTFRAVQAMGPTCDAQSAAWSAVDLFTDRFNGSGGLIAIDAQGRFGIAHNSKSMPVAYTSDGQITVQIAQPPR